MLIINFEGREAKGLSKGRYDETFAGEDVKCRVLSTFDPYTQVQFRPHLITEAKPINPDPTAP